jgi:hypothetical protein
VGLGPLIVRKNLGVFRQGRDTSSMDSAKVTVAIMVMKLHGSRTTKMVKTGIYIKGNNIGITRADSKLMVVDILMKCIWVVTIKRGNPAIVTKIGTETCLAVLITTIGEQGLYELEGTLALAGKDPWHLGDLGMTGIWKLAMGMVNHRLDVT